MTPCCKFQHSSLFERDGPKFHFVYFYFLFLQLMVLDAPMKVPAVLAMAAKEAMMAKEAMTTKEAMTRQRNSMTKMLATVLVVALTVLNWLMLTALMK